MHLYQQSYKSGKNIFIHFNHSCWNIIFLTSFNNTQIVNYFFYFITAGFFLDFFYFMLIIPGCWSNISVAIDNGLLAALESAALLFIKLGNFKSKIIYEKQLLKIRHNSPLPETSSSGRLTFRFLRFFFWKKRNYLFPEGYIIINFALTKLFKNDF